MVLSEGFEPSTRRLETTCSDPLSYESALEHETGIEPVLPLLQSGAWPLGYPCVVQEEGFGPS
jgi:hypothetical protein